MIVAIHQPHFMPWLGYLERMRRADLFIVLDHVQFERGNYQNRTQEPDGRREALAHRAGGAAVRKETIAEKRMKKHRRRPDALVGAEPLPDPALRLPQRAVLRALLPWLQEIFERKGDHLAGPNEALLELLRDAFDISTPLVKSSQLQVEGARSDLVLNLCRAVGADTFLCGDGGSRGYLDPAAFAAGGVDSSTRNSATRSRPEVGVETFVPGLFGDRPAVQRRHPSPCRSPGSSSPSRPALAAA